MKKTRLCQDPDKKLKSLTAEINNGRLAMMAIIGTTAWRLVRQMALSAKVIVAFHVGIHGDMMSQRVALNWHDSEDVQRGGLVAVEENDVAICNQVYRYSGRKYI
eukprot:Skav223470  [mRNA]  locus=scaffold2550:86420:86734:+ [translate_table: standard]